MPVVSRGDRFVFAQVISDVVKFLELDEKQPRCRQAELHARYEYVLETAIRLVRQMPDDKLEAQLPNRPRSFRTLMHHVFQIPVAFLDMEDTGVTLTYESLVVPPPAEMRTSAAIADFGDSVRQRLNAWWQRVGGEDFARPVPTYFGGARSTRSSSARSGTRRNIPGRLPHSWSRPASSPIVRSAAMTSAACR